MSNAPASEVATSVGLGSKALSCAALLSERHLVTGGQDISWRRHVCEDDDDDDDYDDDDDDDDDGDGDGDGVFDGCAAAGGHSCADHEVHT